MYQQLIEDFIQQEQLPRSYLEDASLCFLPLLQDIEGQLEENNKRPFIVGINGAQGTGKSTLAKLLASLLASGKHQVVNLSIDDFYYSRVRREALARTVHPLLRSRGVPGTHDIGLAQKLIQQLGEANATDRITLPGFDKAEDDCLPPERCSQVQGPIDIIILDGWFVGASAQNEQELQRPVNDLEFSEDIDGRWRRYVNQQLAGDYQTLFAQLDMLLMLKAPAFEQVFEWRLLQEHKLRKLTINPASGLMDEAAIRRFIQHFERLTKHCLLTVPRQADRIFELDGQHRIRCPSEN